jgi:hypothetical protein
LLTTGFGFGIKGKGMKAAGKNSGMLEKWIIED